MIEKPINLVYCNSLTFQVSCTCDKLGPCCSSKLRYLLVIPKQTFLAYHSKEPLKLRAEKQVASALQKLLTFFSKVCMNKWAWTNFLLWNDWKWLFLHQSGSSATTLQHNTVNLFIFCVIILATLAKLHYSWKTVIKIRYFSLLTNESKTKNSPTRNCLPLGKRESGYKN